MLRLENDDTLGDADGPQIAVPALDRVFFGEAVAAEQLDAVEADLHALVGARLAGPWMRPALSRALHCSIHHLPSASAATAAVPGRGEASG